VQKANNFIFVHIRHDDVVKNEVLIRLACSQLSATAPGELRHFCARASSMMHRLDS
jgi:hypothetical protein